MKHLDELNEFQTSVQLYKDRESLDKKVKKVDKEKKKFVEEISKRNRISDSISHTAFNQHA